MISPGDATPSSQSTSSSDSSIGIGVGVSVGVLAFIGIFFAARWFHRRPRERSFSSVSSSHSAPQSELISNPAMNNPQAADSFRSDYHTRSKSQTEGVKINFATLK